ncbi:MAG: carbon storage regulator CsrA [Planctomycetales bacterium]|nr:carbon storage regulator CsrA [Planctomycetales bacterium]
MLVLSRKTDQEIVIADNIRVRVLEVRGNQVRLGIVAPEKISVHRAEVQTRRQEFFKEECPLVVGAGI